jgi:hypothetical protein
VGACDYLFHGVARAFVVISRVCDVSAVPCMCGCVRKEFERCSFVEGVGAEFGLCVECTPQGIEMVLTSGPAAACGGGGVG